MTEWLDMSECPPDLNVEMLLIIAINSGIDITIGCRIKPTRVAYAPDSEPFMWQVIDTQCGGPTYSFEPLRWAPIPAVPEELRAVRITSFRR